MALGEEAAAGDHASAQLPLGRGKPDEATLVADANADDGRPEGAAAAAAAELGFWSLTNLTWCAGSDVPWEGSSTSRTEAWSTVVLLATATAVPAFTVAATVASEPLLLLSWQSPLPEWWLDLSVGNREVMMGDGTAPAPMLALTAA